MEEIDTEAERQARAALVSQIAVEVTETRNWLGKSELDPRVMAALRKVLRHAFVSPERRVAAYENRPLPIGHGQTISQPYIVAIMSDMAALEPGQKVLEVGTGCGYQTAVLAELGARVFSIEVVPELAREAAQRLARLGYATVHVRAGDGALGWPEEAPFDAIVVTAAAFQRAPPALIDQLAPGGRLVIPIERAPAAARFLGLAGDQDLMLLSKDAEGRVSERSMLPVAFVPLIEGRSEVPQV
jgi:protein-L-isoaspartate(D-aspartate) O-methyltransferase